MPEKLKLYWRLARLDKPVGWLLLLWPTLWAVWIAGEGKPQPGIVVIFILGVIIMRAAGCVINDYLDRDFDPQVAQKGAKKGPRTAKNNRRRYPGRRKRGPGIIFCWI